MCMHVHHFEKKIPPARLSILHVFWYCILNQIRQISFLAILPCLGVVWKCFWSDFGSALGILWMCFGFFFIVSIGSILVVLWECFWEKIPPCTVLFWPARILILRKNSPLQIYSRTAPVAVLDLSCPAFLMFFKKFSTCTFILPCTSIRHTRVDRNLTKLSSCRHPTCNYLSSFLVRNFVIEGVACQPPSS